MDDVWDDVIIALPFETDRRIVGVWHMYFDTTFVFAAYTLILTALVIYVAPQYRRTRVHVGVPTIVIHDSTDAPHNTEECHICLCIFVVGDQLASH